MVGVIGVSVVTIYYLSQLYQRIGYLTIIPLFSTGLLGGGS